MIGLGCNDPTPARHRTLLSTSDPERDRALIREIVKTGAAGARAETPEGLRKMAASQDFDALLVDTSTFAQLGGLESLDRLRWGLKPVVILTHGGRHPSTLGHDPFRPVHVASEHTPLGELVSTLAALTAAGSLRNALLETAQDYFQRRETLKPSEARVLEGVVSGRLNKQIARELDVSVRTIEQRRRRIYDRFGVTSPAPLCFISGVAECINALFGNADNAQIAAEHYPGLGAAKPSRYGPGGGEGLPYIGPGATEGPYCMPDPE